MESVTKHDTSLLKLQGPRTLPHACNSAQMPQNWKQLGNRATTENLQSIARSVCKHACSLTAREHLRGNYVPCLTKPQRKPVIKLQCANFSGGEQWLQWVTMMAKNLRLWLQNVNKFSQVNAGAGRQQQDNTSTTPTKWKESSGKYSSLQKAGLLLSLSLELMVPSLLSEKHHKTTLIW